MAIPDRHKFKAEIEAAVLAELERVGPDAFCKAALVRRFEGQGASRATLYRYVEAPLKSGMAGQHLARQVKAAAAARAARPEPPPATVQRDAAAKLPAVVRIEEVASSGGVIALTERLVGCIQIAEQLIAHARTEDGGVRSPKQLLAASEHMRRTMETAARLQESLRQTAEMDRFHQAILKLVGDVAGEHPEAAEAIVTRLSQLAVTWGG